MFWKKKTKNLIEVSIDEHGKQHISIDKAVSVKEYLDFVETLFSKESVAIAAQALESNGVQNAAEAIDKVLHEKDMEFAMQYVEMLKLFEGSEDKELIQPLTAH